MLHREAGAHLKEINLRRNDLLSLAINKILVPKCQLVPLQLLEYIVGRHHIPALYFATHK